jgi:hypothetical protein
VQKEKISNAFKHKIADDEPSDGYKEMQNTRMKFDRTPTRMEKEKLKLL